MKLLIADKLSSRAIDRLEAAGHQVENRPDATSADLSDAIKQVDILVVRSTKVPAEVFQQADQLSLVIRAGAGVNTIDVAAASERGVYVANCPGQNTAAVAELTLGFLTALDRRLVDATNQLRQGKWAKKEFGRARGLKGQTLGLLGMGAIGRRVAALGQALEMPVVAWSRSLTPELASQANVGFCATPQQVAEVADVVSIHLAATAETKGLVNREFLAAMKPGAALINTSRGELIETEALREAIEQKQLRVGLDVFANEPSGGEAAFDDLELAQMIVATPHIGASTSQAAEAIANEVVRIVDTFVATGRPPGAVNLEERSPATHQLVVRHLNQVGVLAGVLDALRSEGINVEEMNNVIFEGNKAACCSLRLDGPPTEALLQCLRIEPAHLSVQLSSTSSNPNPADS